MGGQAMKYAVCAAFMLTATAGAEAAAPPTPLFASDGAIPISIRGPVGAIAKSAERSPVPRDGTLSLAGSADQLAVRLSPRGITRRRKETCPFPPLRVDIVQPPAATSLFAGQRRLKLVTHCRPAASFQQHLLLEYAAYRMFNLISPFSYRARLATIDYIEPDGRALPRRYGFFIEDTDDMARRNGLEEARVGDRVPSAQLEARQAARVAMFQYMIGNLDWSMRAGPQGEGCCHNGRLLAGGSAFYTPVPYDFDYSGLVDAPYAVPPDGFKVSSVKSRVYQGYCKHNGQALAAAAEFRAQRPAIEAVLGQVPGIEPRTRSKALAYLARFFDDIATDASVQAKLLKSCVG
jgi:hypothetical protein